MSTTTQTSEWIGVDALAEELGVPVRTICTAWRSRNRGPRAATFGKPRADSVGREIKKSWISAQMDQRRGETPRRAAPGPWCSTPWKHKQGLEMGRTNSAPATRVPEVDVGSHDRSRPAAGAAPMSIGDDVRMVPRPVERFRRHRAQDRMAPRPCRGSPPLRPDRPALRRARLTSLNC